MQTNSKILDDIAKVASGAVGAAFTARDEMQSRLRAEFERVLDRLDLVTRDEFEATRAMAAKARDEQEKAAETIAALEARLAALEGAASKPASSRGAAKAPKKAQTPSASDKTGTKRATGRSGAKRPRTAASKPAGTKPAGTGEEAGSGSET